MIKIRKTLTDRWTPKTDRLITIQTMEFNHMTVCDVRYGSHVSAIITSFSFLK